MIPALVAKLYNCYNFWQSVVKVKVKMVLLSYVNIFPFLNQLSIYDLATLNVIFLEKSQKDLFLILNQVISESEKVLHDILVKTMGTIWKFTHHLIIFFLHEVCQDIRAVEIKPFLVLAAC